MNKIFLETERVILTEVRPVEGHFLLDLDSDPEVMKFISDGRPSTPEEIEAAMGRIMKVIQDNQYRFGFWFAFTKDTQEFMGWFHFRPGKQTPTDIKNIELGYRMKKKFWGKGYATEVSHALLDLGFNRYGIDRVFAIAMKDNHASQNVMKKMGMTKYEDYIETEFPGEKKAAVRYQVTKEEWRNYSSSAKRS